VKAVKLALILVAVVCGALAANADARPSRHFHHGARFGVFIGAPIVPYYYSRYYYPPAYYPYYVPPAPVYMEQAPSAPVQTSSAYWYYCRDSQTYYPYVQQCASPWQQVAPQ
jgi:hypothetical protein